MLRLAAALALLAVAPPAAPFVRDTTGPDPRTGVCLWWGGRSVTYRINAEGAAQTGCQPADAAVAASAGLATWGGATRLGEGSACTDFGFEAGASTTQRTIGRDGTNLVVFRSGRCTTGQTPASHNCWIHDPLTIGLTTMWYDTRTGEILEADMELFATDGANGFYFSCADPGAPACGNPPSGTGCNAVDVQAVVAHEAGHMLGLDHPCSVSDEPGYPDCAVGEARIMAPTVGSVDRRALAADDVEGVCTVYPMGAATRTCAPAGDDSGGGCSSGGGGGAAALLVAALAARLRRRRAPDGARSRGCDC